MIKRLFIVGNGFDLAHNLPTSYEKDFKRIAKNNESVSNFWELYSFDGTKIWSDFENCLAHPDFNSLEEIFNGYFPDYNSDYESDRTAIIVQADISGNLKKSVNDFAYLAEKAIDNVSPIKKYLKLFNENDLFISFNYTHTLERLYSVDSNNVLHIHGEVGKSDLLLGYPEGKYNPEKYNYDPTFKDRGRFIELDISDYVKRMVEENRFDYYLFTAYETLIDKTKKFCKKYQFDNLSTFLNNKTIDEIEIIGHSCKIDFGYFKWLRNHFPHARWIFNPYSNTDYENVNLLIYFLKIEEYTINKIEKTFK